MYAFLSYWYLDSFARFYGICLDTITVTEETLAVREMLRNIGKPLFQDYSRDGRIVGIGLRLARICLGMVAYSLTALLFAGAYLLWLAFPLICLVSLVGSLLGASA